ncbi:GSCFA domain-containing protein [Marinirhabdus gelatinilytica]|uniref:GSCFA family protein n=1 Tax=Marinirhabdus gelatinilytica TaxID=1703343 RepID=A0A370QLJ1_9FLAO|nr:GSCFA domain-containing protein [Marinirhabdus gelatinilytica]RDK89233.1 GSCFA family protein [Marinirhabdus gelatinilytica]
MKLQTTIPLTPETHQIDYKSKVLLLGSCFTENIGGKLDYFKFQNMQNPFGIVFHPLAIEKVVERAVKNISFTAHDVFERDGQWFSFEAHSSVTALSQEDLVVLLNKRLEEFSKYLSEASHVVITFGTAWVYKHNALNRVVANCHKVPQKNFSKELLSVGSISESLKNTASLILGTNPSASIIHTVSPVRHLKDGFVENSTSKAHLLAGIHKYNTLQFTTSHQSSSYFPSYEIMMDELRDYRFYTEDMLHPTPTAVHYIWKRFKQVWIASETESVQKEIDTIQKGLLHRPFNPESEQHLKFQQDLQQKIEKLKQELPHLSFS